MLNSFGLKAFRVELVWTVKNCENWLNFALAKQRLVFVHFQSLLSTTTYKMSLRSLTLTKALYRLYTDFQMELAAVKSEDTENRLLVRAVFFI